jgi:hypothetical protein
MAWRYFFDLPVYRLQRDKYYEARNKYIEDALFLAGSTDEELLRQRNRADPSRNGAFRDHLERTYGGCWEFNEIIGYIRLHFLGSQVRGSYFAVAKQRIFRTRTKTLEFRTLKLVPEIDIENPYGKTEVLSAVREYINNCKRELPNRHIDTSKFDILAPHIDWEALYRDDRL